MTTPTERSKILPSLFMDGIRAPGAESFSELQNIFAGCLAFRYGRPL